MKFLQDKKSLIVFFGLLNIILIIAIVYFLNASNKIFPSIFSEGSKSTYIPTVKGDIKNFDVASRAYIVYDPESRVIIASKNENLRFSPASSLKILTALISLEHYKLNDVLRADGVSTVEGSKMDLVEGETITFENLLYGLLLPSGNDAAYTLARNYPGGVKAFVAKMNEKAKELKMVNSEFFDPDGYDDRNYTTAFDMARLASNAIKNPVFAKVVATKTRTVTDTTGSIVHAMANKNELLGINGVNGIKTGFTNEAGEVLVTSIKQDGKTYIIVIMKSDARFIDTKTIINETIKNIKLVDY